MVSCFGTSRRVSEAAMWHATDLETDPRALSRGRCLRSASHTPTLGSFAAFVLPLGLAQALPGSGQAGAAGASARREPQVIEVRPQGLAGGKYAWPAWAIGVAGFALVLLALAVWITRVRHSRKQ